VGVLSVRAALARATARLDEAGVGSPRFDAEELAAHVLGTSRAVLIGDFTDDQAKRYEELVDERVRRVPLQHLTGVTGFRYLELAVGPGVFVPRPETELLAGWGLDVIAGIDAPVVVDLCAGSGAIALAIANERPDAVVYAVEREEHAMAWARRNADVRAAAGDTPITLVLADATEPGTVSELDGTVTLLLTNPPYVPNRAVVAPEVAGHDPGAALWGGPDGLDVVRRLLARAAVLVRPGGWVGIEHADVQGESVPAVLAATGDWDEIADHLDLAGRPRFTTGRRLTRQVGGWHP
jgi:release factor glutamine methyltransferase